MFGINDGVDSICACHRFMVGVFAIVFFDFGDTIISLFEMDLTLKLLFKLLFVVQIVVQIVAIVTVSFLNFIFPSNLV